MHKKKLRQIKLTILINSFSIYTIHERIIVQSCDVSKYFKYKYYTRNQPFSLVIRWNIKKRKRKRITLSQYSVSAPIDNFDRHFFFSSLYYIETSGRHDYTST